MSKRHSNSSVAPLYDLTVYPFDANELASVFSTEAGFVGFENHSPLESTEWIRTSTPLPGIDAALSTCYTRGMSYDFMVSAQEIPTFLSQASTLLNKYGYYSFQSQKLLPSTLRLMKLSNQARASVIHSAGINVIVYCPHLGEPAQITLRSRSDYDRLYDKFETRLLSAIDGEE